MNLIYQIEFFTYWHAGSGLSGGAHADLLVNKTKDGLPFIPGKTLKGLLREGAETILALHPSMVDQAFIDEIFGKRHIAKDMEGATDEEPSKPGVSFFSNAGLSQNLIEYLLDVGNTGLKEELFHVISSTSIDENGLAKDHTLRQMEVTIPLTLYASIEHFPQDEAALRKMELCMDAVKRMGSGRSRGYGRCRFSIKNIEE